MGILRGCVGAAGPSTQPRHGVWMRKAAALAQQQQQQQQRPTAEAATGPTAAPPLPQKPPGMLREQLSQWQRRCTRAEGALEAATRELDRLEQRASSSDSSQETQAAAEAQQQRAEVAQGLVSQAQRAALEREVMEREMDSLRELVRGGAAQAEAELGAVRQAAAEQQRTAMERLTQKLESAAAAAAASAWSAHEEQLRGLRAQLSSAEELREQAEAAARGQVAQRQRAGAEAAAQAAARSAAAAAAAATVAAQQQQQLQEQEQELAGVREALELQTASAAASSVAAHEASSALRREREARAEAEAEAEALREEARTAWREHEAVARELAAAAARQPLTPAAATSTSPPSAAAEGGGSTVPELLVPQMRALAQLHRQGVLPLTEYSLAKKRLLSLPPGTPPQPPPPAPPASSPPPPALEWAVRRQQSPDRPPSCRQHQAQSGCDLPSPQSVCTTTSAAVTAMSMGDVSTVSSTVLQQRLHDRRDRRVRRASRRRRQQQLQQGALGKGGRPQPAEPEPETEEQLAPPPAGRAPRGRGVMADGGGRGGGVMADGGGRGGGASLGGAHAPPSAVPVGDAAVLRQVQAWLDSRAEAAEEAWPTAAGAATTASDGVHVAEGEEDDDALFPAGSGPWRIDPIDSVSNVSA
jgi:hypothetical protein